MAIRVPVLVVMALGVGACGSSESGSGDDSGWGPLAVMKGPPSDYEALVSGTIEITDECVLLRNGDERSLLVWPSEGTHWDESSRTIRYTADGTVELQHGDTLTVGGGGSSEAESGADGRAWAQTIDWEAEPDPACFTSRRSFVGYRPKAVPEPTTSCFALSLTPTSGGLFEASVQPRSGCEDPGELLGGLYLELRKGDRTVAYLETPNKVLPGDNTSFNDAGVLVDRPRPFKLPELSEGRYTVCSRFSTPSRTNQEACSTFEIG